MELEFSENQESLMDHFSGWIGNQAYVPRNLIAVVTRNMTLDQESGEIFATALRTVLELHPISITGFWTGFSESGIFIPEPLFRVAEKYGRPVDNLLMWWRNEYNCYRHLAYAGPDRQTPTREQATIDVMFFEVDPTHTVVVKAWHCIEAYPAEYEGIESKRDIARRGTVSNFRGFRLRTPKPVICKFTLGYESCEYGKRIDAMAQDLLNGMNLKSSNPFTQMQFVLDIAQEVSGEQGSLSTN